MPWYEDWFDADAYELVYDDRDEEEAERLADLIARAVRPAPDADILDVGTGRGRHALVLARRGYRVTGLDLSDRAIATARARAATEGLAADRVTFVEGDMRALPFRARFDGVTNLFTSFGYFSDADHQRAVRAMADALRPGGWLVQDFLNAPHVRAHLVPESEETTEGVHVRQERWIAEAAEGASVHKRITLTPAEGAPRVYTERVRLLTRADFARLYAAAGLRLAETFGDYDGGRYTPDSPRLVLHAEKLSALKP